MNPKLAEYPISPFLDDICDSLKNSPSRYLILTAETAAGKSTVLPLALLEKFSGKMIMTEPRRIATLGVANRVEELWESACGGDPDQVGYKIHLENKITKATRLEVVTEAILVRQLQSDPVLEDYNLVILDEFHERSVNTDLALAFLKEAMQLRDDLFVIIMSATIDTDRLQKYLGDDTPVMKIPGRQFPVKVVYEPGKSVASVVLRQAQEPRIEGPEAGNILVFLPGISDIRKAQEELLATGLFDDDSSNELCILHSSITLQEQKRIITPPVTGETTKRRVILSSAIAETSLTVPGVTIVIDSGLARVNRMDLNTGMEKLTTQTESEFSAEQRKGRAGRLCPGTCIRLWNQHDARIKDFPPEILRADLVSLVLECSERGVFNVDGIDWLDPPSSAAWKESQELLYELGMIDKEGRINTKGKDALTLGLHPRLAGIALEAFDKKAGKLSEEGCSLLLNFSSYSHSSQDLQKRFINDLERRLKTCTYQSSASILILCGYPDRLARRMTEAGVEPAEYQFAGGRQALLYNQRQTENSSGVKNYAHKTLKSSVSPLWLGAPDVLSGDTKAVIFDYVEISEDLLQEYLEKHIQIKEVCSFDNGKLAKFEKKCIGSIVLETKRLTASAEDYAQAWVNEIKEKGLACLPRDSKVESLLLRADFINQQKNQNEEIDQKLEQGLQENASEWLLPFLAGKTSLSPATVYDALYWYLNGAEIDKLAPESLTLENGRRVKVKYEKKSEIRPVIEIIIQRIFGCFTSPQICGKRVLLRLLSPASRPLQVTEDLEHFWTGAWVDICKEMKGRYPKHNWDYTVPEPVEGARKD